MAVGANRPRGAADSRKTPFSSPATSPDCRANLTDCHGSRDRLQWEPQATAKAVGQVSISICSDIEIAAHDIDAPA